MQFNFRQLDSSQFAVPVGPGQVVFVIGANGSGKSSLMHRLYTTNKEIARRISAHRQTWFRSNAMDLTPATKKQTEANLSSQDATADARWMDHNAMQRATVTIFELIDSENVRARKIAAAADDDDFDLVRELCKQDAPLTVLNELLKVSNLPIEISIEKDVQLFARKNGGTPYSIAELSDGERNAILIAGSVLTANEDSLIIIDEPERHLHRSIVSPLLLSLFEKREDCGFVISTHDISLPLDSPNSSTLLLRSCTWGGNTANAWDADLLTPEAAVPDDVRLAILGARRKMLFIEGDHESLDIHIYSILFPWVSVSPSGGCVEVERAVTGIRASDDLVWIRAFGLVDRDDRDDDAVQALADRGIYALECHSVESLYYCDPIIRMIAERFTEGQALDAARQAIIDNVRPHRDRLCARLVEKRARAVVLSDLPTHNTLLQDPVHSVEFDASGLIAQEQATFDGLVAVSDTDGLVNRYPVRETGALAAVATNLGFKNRSKYESAVRKLLVEGEEARDVVKQKLGALTAAIEL